MNKPFLMGAVIATYNVARYLPELLASLEAQTYGIENVQIVFVDDGSTDDSGEILDRWASGHEQHVTVLHQLNQKVAVARNNGFKIVSADWVTFTDPDDVLHPRFFEEVAKFIELYDDKDLAILATHQMRMDDAGNLTDTHFSSQRFRKGSRLADFRTEGLIQMGAAPAFMRSDVIRSNNLEFDTKIRPTFEDAHFVARYVMLSGRYNLGLVASAKYHYRRRTDGTSLVQSGHASREKYLSVLKYGELDLLRFAAARGPIPKWVETTVLYDLVWYYRNERFIESPSAGAPREVFEPFHKLAAEVLSLISPDSVRTFDLLPLEYGVRLALLHGYASEPYRADLATLVEVDETSQLVHLAYWFNGDVPEERLDLNGNGVDPVYASVEDLQFYGRTLMRRRHLWINRAHTTRLSLDGRSIGFSSGEQPELPQVLTKKQVNPKIVRQRQAALNPLQPGEARWPRLKRLARKRVDSTKSAFSKAAMEKAEFSWRMRSRKTAARYSHAWVFMDRDTTANDNAEHLYRWVRNNRPEVNAWFVLRRTSGDWARLEEDGFRLIEFGSADWKYLMIHADHLASSHIDKYVVNPLDTAQYGRPNFKYTFLQHGVTKDDISRWLNTKKIDLFVTSTPQELQSIAGPGPFKFTPKEVKLVGMPRFDALVRRSRKVSESEREFIVVAPTWRKYLMGAAASDSNARVKNPSFMSTGYAQAYLALLHSSELHDLAARSNKTIAFMPHPNIAPYLDDFDLPAWVRVLSYAENDVQDVLARAAAFVTDYSSIAFDAALIDVPVAYFHFDASEFFAGMHIGRRGYFDYEEHGYGPVVTNAVDVVKAVEASAENKWRPVEPYASRAQESLVTRDGLNCQRVFDAMKALTEGPHAGDSTVPAPTAI